MEQNLDEALRCHRMKSHVAQKYYHALSLYEIYWWHLRSITELEIRTSNSVAPSVVGSHLMS